MAGWWKGVVGSAVIVAAGVVPALAQNRCPHAESDRENVMRSISAAPSCQRAYDMLNACRSNSGGDVELAGIVIARCEASFVAGLTLAAKRAYDDERAACRNKDARSQGTMYVSFAVTCEAGVAARYAGVPGRASRGR